MASADVKIIWDDQSQIPSSLLTDSQDTTDYPIIMTVFSADKGPEEWKQRLNIDDMKAYYGNTPSFNRHGQVLIQAYDGADAGARMTCKRIVSETATLANIGVVANVELTKYQKKDATGNLLWIKSDSTGVIETTDPQYDPATGLIDDSARAWANQINISFSLVSVVLNGNDVSSFANTFYAANKHTGTIASPSDQYALFLFLDNGRGVCNKRFRIYRDTSRSSPVKYVRYFLEISENGEILETLPFTMNPDIVEKSRNCSLSDVVLRRSKQIRAVIFEDEFKAFTENVSYLADLPNNEYAYADCLFGNNLYNKTYANPIAPSYAKIIVSTSPVNLSTVYGIQLVNGSNGAFGDYPINSPEYTIRMLDAFNGNFDDCIYDVDNNRVDAIFDADLPEVVKREIERLVNFREDCVYFRDMGKDIRGIEDIKIYFDMNAVSKSRFCASYINSYDIYDPWTYKQINVTIMYNLVRLFTKHFINGRNRPFCGQKYDCVIPTTDMIPGSLNFMPKRTPAADQKKDLDDLRVNYACMFEGSIIALASEYTSQEQYTQLSYINNVLSVQEVIKAIRVVCPKIRYSFIDEDSDDLVRYKQDIQDMIISKYANRFKSCTIEYVSDEILTLNKIIYAVIKVRFRDFVQTEYFKITALI